MGMLFFDEKSVFEISKPYLKFVTDERRDGRMDGRTDGQAQSNVALQLFQSWGHNNRNDQQKTYRLGMVSKIFYWRA